MAEVKSYKVKNMVKMQGSSSGGAVYCLGIIGAAVYYVKLAEGFGEVLVALIKAALWPAYLVYELFKFIAA